MKNILNSKKKEKHKLNTNKKKSIKENNILPNFYTSKKHKNSIYKQNNILKDKDFNFELNQEYLQSRSLAYQSKDLYCSLKNAKAIEESLMKAQNKSSSKHSSRFNKKSNDYTPQKLKTNLEKDKNLLDLNIFEPFSDKLSNDSSVVSKYSEQNKFHRKNKKKRFSKIENRTSVKLKQYKGFTADEQFELELTNQTQQVHQNSSVISFLKSIFQNLGCSEN